MSELDQSDQASYSLTMRPQTQSGQKQPQSSQPWGGPLVMIGLAVMLVAAVTGLALVAKPHLSLANVAFFYIVPVAVIAGRNGAVAGLLTAIVATLAFNFALVPPIYSFRVSDPDNLATMAMLAVIALVVSNIAARLRRQREAAERQAAYSAALANLSNELADENDPAQIFELTRKALQTQIGIESVIIDEHGTEGVMHDSAPIERSAAVWALANQVPAGRGTQVMSNADNVFLPFQTAEGANYALQLPRHDDGNDLAAAELSLAGLMLDRTSHALDRFTIARRQQQADMRDALLASMSHDLRTPLTTIRGGLDAIAGGDLEHLDATKAEVVRLERMVSGLLDLARISGGGTAIHEEPVDLTETVAAALDTLSTALTGRNVSVSIPFDLPLVTCDPRMLHQILVNLIENAAKYSAVDTSIEILATQDDDTIMLAVIDNGPGLPDMPQDQLFELFRRGENADRVVGHGMGLAIAKGFASALGLTLEARNRPEAKGAKFILRFPLPPTSISTLD